MTTPDVVSELQLTQARLAVLRAGAVVAPLPAAIWTVTGAGAADCLQGLLSNDVVKPGDGSVVFGALLTSKGMIVSDLWAIRAGGSFVLLGAAERREAVTEVLRRSLPPRLAALADRTDEWMAAAVIGAGTSAALTGAGVPSSLGPGAATADAELRLARPGEAAPYGALLTGPRATMQGATARLKVAGAADGTEADLLAARILAGWPATGAEIDEKTLPQEVRFDEIGGVSYTKGCYLGQETVARVHFRGHPNRELRGLLWEGSGPLAGRAIVEGDREVGTIRSSVLIEGVRYGLAPIRREVVPGSVVTAGGQPARVTTLPFPAPALPA
jgi:folate-binding protein YgfZ